MAITTEVRGDILELLVLMFDAAPGATYLTEITSIYESIPGTHDQKMASLAAALSTTGAFQTLHPNFQSGPAGQPSAEFATDFLSTIGLEGNAEARQFVANNYGNGSYAAKAQIMYIAWDFLNEYTGANPDFLRAKEIMLNKAEVSEHFSVTMGGNASGSTLEEIIASLQDVIADVDETQESVDAAIDEIDDDLAVGPELTPGNDLIDVLGTDATNIEGIVDFDAEGNPNGTFNPGDRITGNGNTNLNLVLVDSGDAGFTRLETIEAVNIEAGTDGTVMFNAGGWEDIGSVNLNDGVDGMWVILNNLEAETTISVSNITGTIEGNYDTDGGNLHMELINGDEGGPGISGMGTFEGDVTITGGDNVAAIISDTNGVTLGDVTVTLGDGDGAIGEDDVLGFSMYFSDESPTIGNVNVTLGDESAYNLSIVDSSGDAEIGTLTVMAGETADIELLFWDITDGDVGVGDVSLTGGNNSEIDLYVSEVWDGDVTFGDITGMAGTGADINVTFDGEDTALVVGNVALEVGATGTEDADDPDAYIDLIAVSWDDVDFGDVSLTAGDGAGALALFNYNAAVDLGAVDLMTGASGYMAFGMYDNSGDITVASLSLEGGAYTDVEAWIHNGNNGEDDSYDTDVTVGDVSLIAGASAYAHFTVADHLNTTLGNVTMMAGTSADIYIESEGQLVVLTDDEEEVDSIYLSNITVGNIDVDVTAEEGGQASVSIDNSQNGEDTFNVGNVTVGDVNISVAGDDAEVDFYVWNTATSATTDDNEAAVGNITVGDVTIEVGSNLDLDTTADISMTISQSAGSYTAGNVTVGDVMLTVGDGFASGTQTNEAQITGYIYNYGEDVGDMTVGNFTAVGGDFADITVTVSSTGSGDAGDYVIGNIALSGGESAYIDAYFYHYAAATLGDMTVGNVDVDAAQDSFVSISISHSAWSANVAESAGDLTVGNVDITMGDNATAELYIYSWARFTDPTEDMELVAGDFTVGDVSVAVSATETEDLSGGSYIQVQIERATRSLTGFDGGSFTVGDVTISAAGDDAVIDFYMSNSGTADSMGDMTIGTVSIIAGDEASFGSSMTIDLVNNLTGADVGNLSIEGISIDVGKDVADGDMLFTVGVSSAGGAGDIDLGDLTIDAGDDSAVTIDLTVSLSANGDVGSFSVGDVTYTLGDGGEAYFNGQDFYLGTGSMGDVTVGNFDATLGESATATFSVSVTAADIGEVSAGNVTADLEANSTLLYGLYLGATNIGGVTVGDVDVSVTDGGVATITVSAAADTAAGDITVGDVMLTAAAGTAMTATTELAGEVGGNIYMHVFHSGDDSDTVTLGDLTLAVEGEGDDDWIRIDITSSSSADVTIGDITVSGNGLFFMDNAQHTGANESYIYIDTATSATITIGDVDFSGYENDIELDLGWTDAGAANISAGSGDDTIVGNAGNNIISGGEGADAIDIGVADAGGDDTIVFNEGDSVVDLDDPDMTGVDTITGWDGDDSGSGVADGDKLDFNLVAGTAGNYVEGDDDASDLQGFIDDANDALNSTVKYYADYVSGLGLTLVAVNYGSGEADLIVAIEGDVTETMSFGNFIA